MRREGTGGDRKAPKQSQIARVLVVDRLLLRTNQGGIELENKPNSLHVVGGSHAVARRPQGATPRAGFPPEEHEESENRLSIPFPSHSTLPHLLNLLYGPSPCLDGGNSFCRRTDGRLGDAGSGKSPVCLTMRRHWAKNADDCGGVTCL